MTLLFCFSTLNCCLFFLAISRAESDPRSEQMLFQAARDGDVEILQKIGPEVSLDARDDDYRTPLMVVAEDGRFYAARFLLWNGADASVEDKKGRKARAYLSASEIGFAPLNLLLRAYEFVVDEERSKPTVARPDLVLINDDYVDYTHPQLKDHYRINEKERDGSEGVDDDGNGFVDDSFGWNLPNDAPLRAPLAGMLSGWKDRAMLEKLFEQYQEASSRLTWQERQDGVLPDHPIVSSYSNPKANWYARGGKSGGSAKELRAITWGMGAQRT